MMHAAKICPTCRARFVDGEFVNALGKPGGNHNLAARACIHARGRICINRDGDPSLGKPFLAPKDLMSPDVREKIAKEILRDS